MKIQKKILGSPLLINSGIASLDQALLSLANLLISIIFIKYASKSEYGYYAIAYPMILFVTSIQNAVVNTPLAVLLITKKAGDKKHYVASLFYGQFLIILPTACLFLVVAAWLYFMGFAATQALVAAAACFAGVGLLFREFLRANFFAEENPFQVLKLDAGYSALFLFLVGATIALFKISAAAIFVLIGIATIVVSLIFSRKSGWRYRYQLVKKSYFENWKFGKWALVGVMVTHVQNYSYLYLLGVLLGSTAVAEVSAARLLLAPLLLVQAGWGKIVVPHGSKLREGGQIRHFFKEQVLTSIVFILTISVYIASLLMFKDLLQRFLFSEKYANAFNYLPYWGAIFIIGFASINASYGLQVIKKFHVISKVNFLTMLITVGCAYFLILHFGIKGGLAALIIGGTSLAISLWACFFKAVLSLPEDKSERSMNLDAVNRLFEKEPAATLKNKALG